MEEDKIDDIIKKYEEGNSTLTEEQFLFDNSTNTESSLEKWSVFVKSNKVEIPKDFNNTLWDSFENKKNNKRKILIRTLSAAASIIILISIFIGYPKQKELDYAEKKALLNEAIQMASNSGTEEIEQNIIYENDIIIIYTTDK